MPQNRLPFEYRLETDDPHATAWGGLPLVAEAMDSFGGTAAIKAHLKLAGRRKFPPADVIKSLMMMMAAGGDCFDDIEVFRSDEALQQLLGWRIPSSETARQFLYEFHDAALVEGAEAKATAEGARAFVPEESPPLKALVMVNQALIETAQKRRPLKQATIDIDATVEESHKREAKIHYLNGRGYQPMTAVWAEQDIIVLDEFRDGNVPAQFGALDLIQRAFGALPAGLEKRLFRSDTQSYQPEVLRWLCAQAIEFAIGAQMRAPLVEACKAIPEEAWALVEERADTLVHVAVADYRPQAAGFLEHQARYLAVRLTPRQTDLLESGERRVVYFGVVTNRPGDPVAALRWYWEKAGTIEKTHDVTKNELGAGVPPCGRFGANAAWHRVAMLTYNVLSIMRANGPPPLRDARPKRLRLQLFALPAVVVSHARRLFARIYERLTPAQHAVAMRSLFAA